MATRGSGTKKWTAVDNYFGSLLAPADQHLRATLDANSKAGLPAIDVSPLQGKFLQILVQMTQARRVLEIGTLGGYSTLWMARALPPDGCIVTLEYDPAHADVARNNLLRASLLDRVDLRVGRALDLLPALAENGVAPFDLVFIDADKRSNPDYVDWAIQLSRPGTVIAVDNVVRNGKIVDAKTKDPDVVGIRRMTEQIAAHPRLNATVLQTVGDKGYDGIALAVVLP
ncbi:MAG: O-methyltransferase [Terracidiphilus sp.]